MERRILPVMIFGITMSILIPEEARAYLDPGTGSYIFQILIAVFLGALVGAKVFWHRFTALIRRFYTRKKDDDTPRNS